jgi:hypothetical protein
VWRTPHQSAEPQTSLTTSLGLRAAIAWERSAVVAMQIGWGARIEDAGLPTIPSSNDAIAATMLETLAYVGPERSGAALDLYGSRLPVLTAWPHPDVVRRAAQGDPGP